MTIIRDSICDELGLSRGSDPDAIMDLISKGEQAWLDGILTSENSIDSAIESLRNIENYRIYISSQIGAAQEKYCKVHVLSDSLPCLIALFGDARQDAYPTDMESLILWAIVHPLSTLDPVWTGEGERRILDWRSKLRGRAIVAEPNSSHESVGRTIAAIFGLSHSCVSPSPLAPPVTGQASEVHIRSSECTFDAIQTRLVFEASSTSNPKWRFLSLYRVLENAYLASIKKALYADFDKNAGRALDDAKKKLESEVNQLISLMNEIGLGTEFLAFGSVFDQLKSNGNRYCNALDRSAEGDPSYRTGQEQKAVVHFYKMRCSIAHAGTSRVIFEQQSDAIVATLALLPSVEAIVLKSLGVTVS